MRYQRTVRSYFERHGPAFDRSYEHAGPLYRRLGDLLFRGIIHVRMALIASAAGRPGQRVLDVGTGSGRLLVELAARGASRCVGVDLSPSMLAIGRALAARE